MISISRSILLMLIAVQILHVFSRERKRGKLRPALSRSSNSSSENNTILSGSFSDANSLLLKGTSHGAKYKSKEVSKLYNTTSSKQPTQQRLNPDKPDGPPERNRPHPSGEPNKEKPSSSGGPYSVPPDTEEELDSDGPPGRNRPRPSGEPNKEKPSSSGGPYSVPPDTEENLDSDGPLGRKPQSSSREPARKRPTPSSRTESILAEDDKEKLDSGKPFVKKESRSGGRLTNVLVNHKDTHANEAKHGPHGSIERSTSKKSKNMIKKIKPKKRMRHSNKHI